jgi:hypothetical protein
MYRIIRADGSDESVYGKPSASDLVSIVGKSVELFRIPGGIRVYASTEGGKGRMPNSRIFNLLDVVVFGDAVWTNE